MSDEPLTYGTYLKVPELLALQHARSAPAHHDEPLFIIIHQVYELWFKLILHELDTASALLRADRIGEATRLLRRVVEIQQLLVGQVRILETMRPQDFLGFRYHLNPASGFQSVQFRELEFTLGLKDPSMLERIVCGAPETERLQQRLAAPSIGDELDALLARRGFDRQAADWRLRALVTVYEHPDAQPDLLALCEVLVDVDEELALWRAHHVQMVERMIGSKRGTGGSDGVGYLRTTLPKRAFPELWQVRSLIGQEPA